MLLLQLCLFILLRVFSPFEGRKTFSSGKVLPVGQQRWNNSTFQGGRHLLPSLSYPPALARKAESFSESSLRKLRHASQKPKQKTNQKSAVDQQINKKAQRLVSILGQVLLLNRPGNSIPINWPLEGIYARDYCFNVPLISIVSPLSRPSVVNLVPEGAIVPMKASSGTPGQVSQTLSCFTTTTVSSLPRKKVMGQHVQVTSK